MASIAQCIHVILFPDGLQFVSWAPAFVSVSLSRSVSLGTPRLSLSSRLPDSRRPQWEDLAEALQFELDFIIFHHSQRKFESQINANRG